MVETPTTTAATTATGPNGEVVQVVDEGMASSEGRDSLDLSFNASQINRIINDLCQFDAQPVDTQPVDTPPVEPQAAAVVAHADVEVQNYIQNSGQLEGPGANIGSTIEIIQPRLMVRLPRIVPPNEEEVVEVPPTNQSSKRKSKSNRVRTNWTFSSMTGVDSDRSSDEDFLPSRSSYSKNKKRKVSHGSSRRVGRARSPSNKENQPAVSSAAPQSTSDEV